MGRFPHPFLFRLMIQTILKKIFGSRNDRLLKQYQRQVRAINALEPEMEKLSDGALRLKTVEFRKRVQERLAKIPDSADGDAGHARRLEEERAPRAARRWTSCCRKRSRWCAKRAGACSTCAISTCS